MISLDEVAKSYRTPQRPQRRQRAQNQPSQQRQLRQQPQQRSALEPMTAQFRDGEVAYLLGPNGAGKSTLIRLLAGLSTPTSGSILIDGKAPGQHRDPLRTIGIAVDAHSFHPRATATQHLQWMCLAGGIDQQRIDEVLDMVGLSSARKVRIGDYSLGMQQRLTIAGALLGDPHNIVLDEPLNGLDVDGIRWARELFCTLAQEGRCVVVSTHLLPEVARTGDHIVVMGAGKVLSDSSLMDLIHGGESAGSVASATTPRSAALADALEERYVELTHHAVEYSSGGAA